MNSADGKACALSDISVAETVCAKSLDLSHFSRRYNSSCLGHGALSKLVSVSVTHKLVESRASNSVLGNCFPFTIADVYSGILALSAYLVASISDGALFDTTQFLLVVLRGARGAPE